MSSSSSSFNPKGVTHRQSLSNLPLQVALHFNVLFSVIYFIVIGACSLQKVLYYNKKVSVSVMTVWVFFEVVRLYYGISGNMKEQVPELATFLLITIFPQIPFMLYFAYIQPVIFPVDPILGTFMLIYLLVQIYFGLITMRQQIRSQTAQFMRLCDSED
jgi:transmembrane protein 17